MRGAAIGSYKQLNGKKLKAVELRYKGESHKEIAYQLSLSPATIDHWFERSGLLHEAYAEYCEHMADQALAEAVTLIRQYTVEAVETLHTLSQPPHPVAVREKAAGRLAGILLRNPELAKPRRKPSPLQRMIDEDMAAIAASMLPPD